MKIKLNNEERIQEKIKDLGIGALIIGIGIFFAILMIGWLLYDIFIFSKG